MPWFLVDDRYHSHPQVLATTLEARGLWVTAGSWSSAHLTDGAIRDHELASLGGTPKLAGELVAAGLWRRVRGGYRFRDGVTHKIPSKETVEATRKTSTRRQALFRNAALKQAIRERDGDRCRYCGTLVRWGKGQAPDSGTFDHVDPQGDNTLVNIVVACLSCNSRKKDRTPDQARLTLCKAYTEAYTEAFVQLPNPDPVSSGSVVNQGADRNGRAPPDLTDLIIEEILKATGRHITPEWAQRTAGHILGGRDVANPAAYICQAIRAEPNPKKRFLPLY